MSSEQGFLWWLQMTAYASFAAFGGFMGHLLRTMENGDRLKWGRAFLESGSAAFVGVLVLLMCQAMDMTQEWTGVIVGVSGWLGANATIRILESVVRKRLGISDNYEGGAPYVAPTDETDGSV